MLRIVAPVLMVMIASVAGVRVLDQASHAPSKTPAAKSSQTPSNSRTMVIKAENGHFATDARIDGRHLDFLVDTGASQIAIRESDAARLGYRPAPRDYSIRIETANGEGRAALIELAMVEVGDILVRHVQALVVPDRALNVNLLGMSFLSRVRWTHERGQLVLEQ